MKEPAGMKKRVENRVRGKRFLLDEFDEIQQLNGVCYYLHDRGLKDAEDQHFVIKLYVVHMRWEIPPDRHVLEACVKIQKDFKSFIKWLKRNEYLHKKENL